MTKKGIAIKQTAGIYDLYAPTEKSKFRKKQINLINLKPGEKVLEVGCGTGSLSVLAKTKVGGKGEVIGLDLSPKMIKQAGNKTKKYNLDIKFIEGSIDNLPFPDNYFDVVISSWMFHHLPIKIKKGGLKEIHRVLKKGGRFSFSDFCRPRYIIGYLMALGFIWTDYMRVQIFGKMPEYFKEAGFKNIILKKKGFLTENYLMYK